MENTDVNTKCLRTNSNSHFHEFYISLEGEMCWNYMLEYISQKALINYNLHHFNTKCDRGYYKMWQSFFRMRQVFYNKVWQFITKCDSYYKYGDLTKCESYYKMSCSLQNASV